jgi:hypothetical protein
MIFTNVSHIGDFFLLWPVASWYYKNTGKKIHFVVSKNYYMYYIVENFLKAQPFTEKISYVDVASNALDLNCFTFNPENFGISGEYLNFGFWKHPDYHEYIPEFYAKKYNLGVDYDYIPTLIEFEDEIIPKVTMEVAHQLHGYWPIWKANMPIDTIDLLKMNNTFEKNTWYSVKAKERHFGASSSAVLMDLFNLPTNIYSIAGLNTKMYYKNNFHNIINF